jgi:hypothetical protein
VFDFTVKRAKRTGRAERSSSTGLEVFGTGWVIWYLKHLCTTHCVRRVRSLRSLTLWCTCCSSGTRTGFLQEPFLRHRGGTLCPARGQGALRGLASNVSEHLRAAEPVEREKGGYAVSFYLPKLLGRTPIAAATIGSVSEPTFDGAWALHPCIDRESVCPAFRLGWLRSPSLCGVLRLSRELLAGSISGPTTVR